MARQPSSQARLLIENVLASYFVRNSKSETGSTLTAHGHIRKHHEEPRQIAQQIDIQIDRSSGVWQF